MGWRKDLRKKMRKQRVMARMSKRQAKRLRKIYKEMSPEEIAEMNRIAPEIATGLTQLQEDGGGSNIGDPVATMAEYNSTYGEGSGGGEYYPDAADNYQTFEEVEGLEGEGGDEDPYASVASGIGGIISQFRRNFETRNESFDSNSLDGQDLENLFGIGNFFKQLSGKNDDGTPAKKGRGWFGKISDSVKQNRVDWCKQHGYIKEQKENSMEELEDFSLSSLPVSALLVDAAICYAGYYVYQKHNELLGGLIFGYGVIRVVKTIKAAQAVENKK